MLTVKYKDKIWELIVTKHNRLIMRNVIDDSYWLPISNSNENRLDGLKIKAFNDEEKMFKYAVKLEQKEREYFNDSNIVRIYRKGKEIRKYE